MFFDEGSTHRSWSIPAAYTLKYSEKGNTHLAVPFRSPEGNAASKAGRTSTGG
jgi:hypothetical protein